MPKQDPAVGAKLTINFDDATYAYKDTAGQTADGFEDMDAAFAAFLRHNDVFDSRGIHRAIREARPYAYWTPEDLTPLHAAWDPFIEKSKRGFVTRVGHQSDGYVINRFPPPGIGAKPVPAEIRPFNAVETAKEYVQQRRERLGKERKKGKYIHPPVEGGATRLDMHPFAVPLFERATRVFFGIEGCLKADSILTQGEAVFSVPAVTQWKAPELNELFVRKYLAGKKIFIVPDMDWHRNWMVISQAIQCRSYLRSFGLEVHVAAPPIESGLKGVDDFLGAGNTVDDMVVVGRELPPAFDEWVRGLAGRVDGAARDAQILQALSLCAGLTEDQNGVKVERPGQIHKAIWPIKNLIDAIDPEHKIGRKSVSRAIDNLCKRPGLTSDHAITVEGSTDTKEPEEKQPRYGSPYWTPYDWEERPIITVAPELRSRDREHATVGEVMAKSLNIEAFLHRDVSMDSVRHLRGELSAA